MSRPVSATLEIRTGKNGDSVSCSACGHGLAPAGKPWKSHAALSEIPMRGAGGKAYSGSAEALLRRFSCPSCGTLLDSEMALPGEPFLDDIVRA